MTSGTEWRRRVSDTWAAEWQRTEHAMHGTGEVLDDAIGVVAPTHGQALDIGCGVGSTSLALARAVPSLQVIGVDVSASLINVARRRAAGVAKVTLYTREAIETAATLAPLDLLVSRHGVMFFDDPRRAFTRLRGAARPGAPPVFSCFRPHAENQWATLLDAATGSSPTNSGGAGPFSLAAPDATVELLRAAGWTDVAAAAYEVRYVLSEGADPIEGAVAFARCIGPAASVLTNDDPTNRARIEERLRTAFASRARARRVSLSAAVWIRSARA